jgi:transcriptional regulator with XRE-family HTH domain
MGGNRTCPDNCLLAAWYGLPEDQRSKERRRPIVAALAKQGYTQDAIAMQLGVSQYTVSKDLETLLVTNNVKGQGKDTRGRKRSTGRPKGSKRASRPRQSTRIAEDAAAAAVLDHGMTLEQAAAQTGLASVQQVKTSVAREEGRREGRADPEIDPKTLSKTAQEKLDAAIRRYERKLDAKFAHAVDERVRQRIDEIVLPHWKEKIDQAQQLYARRRGLMDKDTFNTIRRALHPDSRLSISDRRLGHAFNAFMALEKYLLDEKDSPTDVGSDLPDNLAAWDKMREKVRRDKAAGRTAVKRT